MAEGAKESWGTKLFAWAIIVAMVPTFIGLLDGLTTLGKQLFGWFRTGIWTPQTTWEGLHYWGLASRPAFEWVVPNAFLNWILDGARWFWMPMLGVIYMGLVLGVVITAGTYADKGLQRFKRGSAPTP